MKQIPGINYFVDTKGRIWPTDRVEGYKNKIKVTALRKKGHSFHYIGKILGISAMTAKRYSDAASEPMKPLRPYKEKNGYLTIQLSGKGKVYVHRVVLETWKGPCPPGYQARHLNGDRADNRLKNLEWGTRKENCADRESHGTTARGSRNGNSKLTEEKVFEMRKMRSEGRYSLQEIADKFEVSLSLASQVCRGTIWSHLGGVPDPKTVRLKASGTRSSTCKLDEDRVREIRRRHAGGETQLKLSKEYGVTSNQIGMIVNRKSWAHVD